MKDEFYIQVNEIGTPLFDFEFIPEFNNIFLQLLLMFLIRKRILND
jgi:hypothetical protein